MLDPDNDFNVERTLTKEDVQKLIQVRVMAVRKNALPSCQAGIPLSAGVRGSVVECHVSVAGHGENASSFRHELFHKRWVTNFLDRSSRCLYNELSCRGIFAGTSSRAGGQTAVSGAGNHGRSSSQQG